MSSYNSLLTKAGIGLLALMLIAQSAGAFSWVLYGTVTNAASCAPISGAVISAPYNGNTHNITNSTGGFRLYLGTGNWSVTVSAAGYNNGSYLTPYYSSGAWLHNFSLVPTGGQARNPPCFSSTVINTTKTTVTPGVNPNATTSVAAYTTSIAASSSGSAFPTSVVVVVVIVIIIIVAIAYFMMSGKKKKEQHHHPSA